MLLEFVLTEIVVKICHWCSILVLSYIFACICWSSLKWITFLCLNWNTIDNLTTVVDNWLLGINFLKDWRLKEFSSLFCLCLWLLKFESLIKVNFWLWWRVFWIISIGWATSRTSTFSILIFKLLVKFNSIKYIRIGHKGG